MGIKYDILNMVHVCNELYRSTTMLFTIWLQLKRSCDIEYHSEQWVETFESIQIERDKLLVEIYVCNNWDDDVTADEHKIDYLTKINITTIFNLNFSNTIIIHIFRSMFYFLRRELNNILDNISFKQASHNQTTSHVFKCSTMFSLRQLGFWLDTLR